MSDTNTSTTPAPDASLAPDPAPTPDAASTTEAVPQADAATSVDAATGTDAASEMGTAAGLDGLTGDEPIWTIFYPIGDTSLWTLLFLTLLLGGLGAWFSGRALANGWRPVWMVVAYMVPLAFAIRFLHYALFEMPMWNFTWFLMDFVLYSVIALIGYRVTRVDQMTQQYPWLYERAGAFSWKARAS